MPDEIETIDKNPKSWAAWKMEAERLQAIIDGMALSAMEREPVAHMWKWLHGTEHDPVNGHEWHEFIEAELDAL